MKMKGCCVIIKVQLVFGTRPEAIKMAPIYAELRQHPEAFSVRILVTAQHREMLDPVLRLFEITPDYDLNIMARNQSLTDLTVRILPNIERIFIEERPDLVLVHGDTTTTFLAALAAFYQKITVDHVEAGLRTHHPYSPWPEEINRQIVSRIAKYHFAPTTVAKENLVKENIPEKNIFVTGNTVIDALVMTLAMIESSVERKKEIMTRIRAGGYDVADRRFLLVTGHRRENFGEGILNICRALQRIARKHPEVDIVYPVHFNPNVREPVQRILAGIPNLFLIDPLEYDAFVYMMSRCYLILTDSGGIQEEASSLGKPVLVMRQFTERPEAVEAGTARLVGTRQDMIVNETERLLNDSSEYQRMMAAGNPYGDGRAAQKIVQVLLDIKNQ